MKKRIILIIMTLAALTLECLPWGVVLNFASSPDASVTETFSYFSLTPFGYAVFGPLAAAVLTCVLLILTIIYAAVQNKGLKTTAAVISLLSALLSVSPILYGLNFLTAINVAVTLILLAQGILLLIKEKTV